MKALRTVSIPFLILLLVGCVDVSNSDSDDEPVLRIHDVSGLSVDRLDRRLNALLDREDLPLRGQVELLDDTRLAVNGSLRLQREIERMLAELRNGPNRAGDSVDRPFRIQYWVLQMSQQDTGQALPAGLDEVTAPMADEFPGFEFQVRDFLESYHYASTTSSNISSGAGSIVFFNRLRAIVQGVEFRGRVQTSPPEGAPRHISYSVDHLLRPGESLVLGRAHGGGMGEEAVYQVLIARMEWTD